MENLKDKKGMTPSRALLISFEGTDGSGKSTQVEGLANKLSNLGHDVYKFREPGGTPIGEEIRHLLLGNEEKSDQTSLFLFMAARNELLNKKILPLLDKKCIILMDRFIDSSISYQGFAQNLGMQEVLDLHQFWPLNLRPNMTFYLKCNASKRRGLRNTNDHFEKKGDLFQEKVAEGLDQLAKNFPSRIKVINGQDTVEEVGTGLWKHLQSLLKTL